MTGRHGRGTLTGASVLEADPVPPFELDDTEESIVIEFSGWYPSLVCRSCGDVLAEVEQGDSLATLVAAADDHDCEEEAGDADRS